ncbi:DNA-binding protein [Agrobacterium tumefaciens]|nr:helix-turn-helix domain-containing protein [Agrobacterium tumefaciens]TQN61025.1 DNA-binding protein [Agrobacterium tumefaciens]
MTSNLSQTSSVDPLLTDEEVAGIFKVHRATIWRRVADGSLPQPIRLGSISRFPQSEIIAALEAAKHKRAA